MPYNGAGNFVSLPPPQYPAVPGDVIRAAYFNAVINDLIGGLTNAVTRDGQSPPTSNLPMAGKRHTGVSDATAVDQYASYGQLLGAETLATFLQQGTGAVARSFRSKMRDTISVKDFGAVGDGVADDTVALQNAFAMAGFAVYIPAGTYLYTANITPTCAAIFGDGDLTSILKPSGAVTRGLSLGAASYPRDLRNFQVLGTAATTATGIYFGEASSVQVFVHNVRCKGFSGVGGVGARIGYMLKSSIIGLTCETNENGLLVQQASGLAFPTTLHLDSCVFTGNTKKGAKILDCNGILFTNTDFESSGEEGLYCDTSLGRDIINLIVGHGCWFEDNNSVGGSNAYHLLVSSNTGARTIRPYVIGAFFAIGTAGRAQRCISFDGQDIRAYGLDYILPSAERSTEVVSIKNGAYGTTDHWPDFINYNTDVVVDAVSLDLGPYAAMRSYAPGTSFSTNLGAYGTSFSGVPTVNTYKYSRRGRVMRMEVEVVLQLLAVTPAWIKIPVPSGLAVKNNNTSGSIMLVDGAVGKAAVCLTQTSDNTILCRPADLSNLTSGNAITLRVGITFELN